MSCDADESSPASAPQDGQVVTVRLDGRDVSVWWGHDGDYDRLAVRGGRVLTWPTADACEAEAKRMGWVSADEEDIPRDTIDCEPVQDWLRGRRYCLDPASALDLWNFEWDVTGSITNAWPLLGRVEGRCHAKLTGAAVPWLTGQDTYRPRWTAIEMRCLKRVLSRAIHTMRRSLP